MAAYQSLARPSGHKTGLFIKMVIPIPKASQIFLRLPIHCKCDVLLRKWDFPGVQIKILAKIKEIVVWLTISWQLDNLAVDKGGEKH
jgi:hypothetical protein